VSALKPWLSDRPARPHPKISKRFGATTVVALARAPASDPIDSRWISIVAGLIPPAADVGFAREDLCEARHVHRVADSDEVGHLFQSEAGHRSDLKPAKCSDAMSATLEAPFGSWVEVAGSCSARQAAISFRLAFRKLSPSRVMR